MARGSGWRRSRSPTCGAQVPRASSSTGRRSWACCSIYDRLRGYADGLLVHAREVPQIKIEAALFGKPIPTVWLQSHLWHGANDLRWWDYATWFVYLTHFVVTLLVAAVLWTWAHDHFARFASDGVRPRARRASRPTSSIPPSRRGWQRSTVRSARRTGRSKIVWPHVPVADVRQHLRRRRALREQRRGDAVAARGLRAARRAVPLATLAVVGAAAAGAVSAGDGVRLVYSGEHYVVDCIAGWAYAAFAYFMRRIRLRAARRAACVPRAGIGRLNEIAQVHFCDVTVDGERWPVIGWTIATAGGTVLVDTGMVDSTPELDADWGPVIFDWDVPDLVAVINTHLHFDHCGGNRRYAGLPTYVQRIELESARRAGVSRGVGAFPR